MVDSLLDFYNRQSNNNIVPVKDPSQKSNPQKSIPSLSVVLSFRNEEENISALIQRLRDTLSQERKAGNLRGWELIFVNDDSTDRSEELLRAAAKGHRDIRILTTSRPFGVSPCVLAGMEYSTGDLVVYMDVDLQDPPEVIADMLRAWREGEDIDVVHTFRLSRAGESRIRLGVTHLGYWLLQRLTPLNLPRNVGDFKLLSRRAVDHLAAFREKRPYLRGLVVWIGFRQETVGYHREARHAGRTKFPIFSWDVIRNFLDSALISFSDAPLRLASLLGFMISACAFLVALASVAAKIQGMALPPWLVPVFVILLLGGIQLISIGVLGLYLSSIHVESRRRPNYIIKRKFGFRQKTKKARKR